MKVSVLGAGSWGTALACVLARNNVQTTCGAATRMRSMR